MTDFDELMSAMDTPMVVVTTAAGQERGGCLVGFHAQSSIDPSRHCLWLSKANHTYRPALWARHLGVHFLTESDGDLAELFGTLSGDDIDKFANGPLRRDDGRGADPCRLWKLAAGREDRAAGRGRRSRVYHHHADTIRRDPQFRPMRLSSGPGT